MNDIFGKLGWSLILGICSTLVASQIYKPDDPTSLVIQIEKLFIKAFDKIYIYRDYGGKSEKHFRSITNVAKKNQFIFLAKKEGI